MLRVRLRESYIVESDNLTILHNRVKVNIINKKGGEIMPKVPLCDLGKSIKRRLDDICETQKWLIEQVREDTGLFFDERYLHKILTGRIATTSIVSSICKILEIENPYEKEAS